MVDPSPRQHKRLVRDGAAWLREARAYLGWSPEELIAQIDALPFGLRFRPSPSVDEVRAFEAELPKRLPTWLRLARMALARTEVADEDVGMWFDRHTWYTNNYQGGDPMDMCRPWVFRSEYYLLEQLDALPDDIRQTIFNAVRDLAGYALREGKLPELDAVPK